MSDRLPDYRDSAAYLLHQEVAVILDSVDEVEELECELDIITTTRMGLPAGTRARSKGWRHKPDPWVIKLGSGETAATASGMKFSVVEIQTTPVRTYCSFSVPTWTSMGWRNDGPSVRPLEWDVEVKDGTNGSILDSFKCIKYVYCIGNEPFYVEHKLDPIYDIVRASRHRGRGTSRWRPC